jgi:4'-phosphopantetheinyl transferase
MGLVALAHGCAIGVDLEDETAGAEGDAVAGDMLSRSELEEYRRLPAGMRPRAFLRAWTAKEAVLKATGLGLALSPRTVSLRSLTAAVPELAEVPSLLGPAAGWRLSVLDAGPGRIATLAVIARAQPRLSYRDWSRSASRTARAMTVSVGLAKPAVGNAELPAT